MKAKLFEPDQRLSPTRRYTHACDIGGWPNAQALAFGPKPFHKGDMKAVQLDARMKMIFEFLHNARPQKGLGSAQANLHDDSRPGQEQQQATGDPLHPTSAQELSSDLRHLSLLAGFYFRRPNHL
jgi:hypothetical protein